MARRRKVFRCFRRKSIHSTWFLATVILLLIYHITYDARTLFAVFFRSSEITINVANYGLSDDEYGIAGQEELRKDYDMLVQQVNTGQKPNFVLDFGMNQLNMKRILRKREKSNRVPKLFNAAHPFLDGGRPSLGYYRSFSELPAFSEVGCRNDLLKRIPNIVHYIWFGKLRMTFLQYLSVRSAASIQKPSKIIIHTDSGEPIGKFWNSLRAEIPCLEVEYLPKPIKIFGNYPLTNAQQQSHVSRIKVLYQHGGIYANLNVIFLRPFDSLMDNSLVIGREEDKYYSNSVILAERGASFLGIWFQSYNRRIADWATYSMYIPWRLSSSNPKAQVHVEKYSMARPGFKDDGWVSQMNWVLDENYCVHLYNSRERIRLLTKESPLDAIAMDNTYGQLTRMALFGKPYLNDSLAKYRKSVHSRITCSHENLPQRSIPNVVHYLLHSSTFSYKYYLSVRSAARFLKPEKIRIYLSNISEPDSYFWIRMKMEIDCIEVFQVVTGSEEETNHSTKISIQPFIQNYLWKSGGLFLGFDVLVTSSLSDLMEKSVVMGSSSFFSENIHILLFESKSLFLKKWFTWKSSGLKQEFEKYMKDTTNEKIEIIPNFPSTIAKHSSSINLKELRCILLENNDSYLNFEEVNEYDILRSETIDGQIARTILLGA